MDEPEHLCHAEACTMPIPPLMFMCRTHWYMVPIDIRGRIWAHYVPGQEERKDPTDAYLDVAMEAIDIVARREGRR
jgi:hypothetical protein